MQLSRFIARRLALGKHRSFASLIIRLAWVGVGLSVGVMIVSVAIVVGYKNQISEKVLGFGGDIEIHSTGTTGSFDYVQFRDSDSIRMLLKAEQNVTQVAAVMSRPGILKSEEELEGIVFKGVGTDYPTDYLQKCLLKGRLPAFGDSIRKREILVSAALGRKMRLDTGMQVKLYFINEPVRVIPCTITGIYETGLEENDLLYVVGSLLEMQRIFAGRDQQITHYELQTTANADPVQISKMLNSRLPRELISESLIQLNPQIFDWLGYMDQNISIILSLMVVVAGINMITALLILIIERTNMIGVLKALGAGNGLIKRIFMNHALYILVLGLAVGNVLGLGLCLLQSEYRLITLPQETYYLSFVPVELNGWHVLAINAGTVAVCMGALLLPVRLINRIDPVKAIRFN